MTQAIQSRTRQQIRRAIGRRLGVLIVGEVTDTKDTTSLWDTGWLAKGGTNEYVGRHVVIYDATGSIVDGEKSFVTAFDSTNKDCTMSPAFTANLTDGDKYEMWQGITIDEVDEEINNAVMEVSDDALQTYQDTSQFTASDKLEYDISTFKGISDIEYVRTTSIERLIENCESVWTELVDGDVTATRDTSIKKLGNASLKLVVASGASANDILATEAMSSLDLTDCDTLEIWVYTGATFAAGAIQVLLDNTAQCASPVESLDIPATTAATWTRHSISLANPQSDGAIISVGIKMITDTTYTLYFDDIRATLAGSRQYAPLHHDHWDINLGSTKKVRFTRNGLAVMGNPTQMRWNGYQLPALLSADTTASEIDPSWIIAYVVGTLLTSHVGVRALNPDADKRGKTWLDRADKLKPSIMTHPREMVHWL